MGFIKLILRSFTFLVAIGLIASTSCADDVILDAKPQSIGQFSCSTSPSVPTKTILFGGRDSGILTAGELWKIFDERGISSLDRLTFSLDLKENGESDKIGIRSMELTIEDSSDLASPITKIYSSENHSLMINGDDIVPFKPEAFLEVQLDYDFMKKYTSDSKEKISFAVSGDQNSEYEISVPWIESRADGFFSWKYGAVGAFAVFWALVFIGLNRLTKPQVVVQEKKTISSQKRQALSA